MEKVLETQMELSKEKKGMSYEKGLNSEEPFVRLMYEDLERRIVEFEQEAITKGTEKTKLKEFFSVAAVMAAMTIFVFVIL